METINYKNLTIKIEQEQDTEPADPRGWDNFGAMICFHRKYILGDKHNYNESDYNSLDELAQQLKKDGALIIIPLTLYDHSGLSITYGSKYESGFPDPRWDCSNIGFIVAFRDQVAKLNNWKRFTKARLKTLEGYLRSEVKEYDKYLTGEVYYYSVNDSHGNSLDSCSYILGYDEAEKMALESAETCFLNEQKKKQDKLKDFIKNRVPLEYRQTYFLNN